MGVRVRWPWRLLNSSSRRVQVSRGGESITPGCLNNLHPRIQGSSMFVVFEATFDHLGHLVHLLPYIPHVRSLYSRSGRKLNSLPYLPGHPSRRHARIRRKNRERYRSAGWRPRMKVARLNLGYVLFPYELHHAVSLKAALFGPRTVIQRNNRSTQLCQHPAPLQVRRMGRPPRDGETAQEDTQAASSGRAGTCGRG